MSDECKYQSTNRFFLYFMVFWIFLDCNGCELTQKIKKMESQLNLIEQKVNRIDTVITHNSTNPLEK